MCIFSGADVDVEKTLGYVKLMEVGQVNRWFNAYKFTAKFKGKAVIIVQVPGKVLKFVDTTGWGGFMDKLEGWYNTNLKETTRNMTRSAPKSIVRYQKVGVYDTYMGDLDDIKQILLAGEFASAVDEELFNWYKTACPTWDKIVVCYDANSEVEAQPFAFEWEGKISHADPTEGVPEIGFVHFPALDNEQEDGVHRGIPTDRFVNRNHLIFFGFDTNQVQFPPQAWLTPEWDENMPLKYVADYLAVINVNIRTENGDIFAYLQGAQSLSYFSDMENLMLSPELLAE